MRVALTLEQCWHPIPGGIGVAAVRSVQALAERGDVDLVGVTALHRRAPVLDLPSNVPTRSLPLPRTALYESWQLLARPAVQWATGPVDVVHATGTIVPPAHGAALVVTVHDLAPWRHPEHFSRRGRRVLARSLRLARAHADAVVAPSRFTADACRGAGFAPERIHVVPWGVEVPTAGTTEPHLPPAVGDRPYLLAVGTIEPRKNLRRLLRAFADVSADARLVVVGPTGWNEDLRALVAADERVVAIGPVDERTLDALYRHALALCYPSLLEGFGLPVLEAMARGIPVLTSRDSAPAEVAGDAAILVDPLDEGDLTRGIRRLVDDLQLRVDLGGRGRDRAAALTWEHTADGLVAAYQAALERTSSP